MWKTLFFLFLSLALIATNVNATVATTNRLLVGLRGGGMFGWLTKVTASDKQYRESLEIQIQSLERQVRLAKQESASLKQRLTKASSQSRKEFAASLTASKSMEGDWKEKIDELSQQIKELELIKKELEELLELEKKRALKQEEMIEAERKKWLETERRAQEELKKVRETLKESNKKELANMEKVMTQRLEKERLKWEKEMTGRIKEERQKAAEAVEKERVKMRKLVKALADREKKVLEKDYSKGKKRVVAGQNSHSSPRFATAVARSTANEF
mmetsp:Transcript_14826/g.22577  ORF Transcript_14826/g.22577 Transcript_14826/m.22577 type:complete len:273 (-) Transcript_14826:247-1065(-)